MYFVVCILFHDTKKGQKTWLPYWYTRQKKPRPTQNLLSNSTKMAAMTSHVPQECTRPYLSVLDTKLSTQMNQ